MQKLYTKFKSEHHEMYQKLDETLYILSTLKNKRNDSFLIEAVNNLLFYVEQLINQHFKEEEEKLFPEIKDSELLKTLLSDHKAITDKYNNLKELLSHFSSEKDYKKDLLFPSYNLIATISHHGQREDATILNQ